MAEGVETLKSLIDEMLSTVNMDEIRYSRNDLKKILENKDVKVNNSRVKENITLNKNDKIVVFLRTVPEFIFTLLAAEKIGAAILCHDGEPEEKAAAIADAAGKYQVAGNYEEAGAAAAVQGNLDTEVLRAKAAEEANANAIAAEKARMDAFLADATISEAAVDTLKEIQWEHTIRKMQY